MNRTMSKEKQMFRNPLFTIIFLGLLLSLDNKIGLAQHEAPKLEIGPQLSVLKLKFVYKAPGNNFQADDYWAGVGGRVTYNVTDNLAFEGTLEKFFTDVRKPISFISSAQPNIQGFVGLIAGLRRLKFGVFGKLRPGFTEFTPVLDCTAIDFASCSEVRDTSFSLDAGGVVEGYISRRFMVRGDVGALYLRHRDTTLFFPGEPHVSPFLFTNPGFKKVTLKFSVGFGFRF